MRLHFAALPDIARAIAEGAKSSRHHFDNHGRTEAARSTISTLIIYLRSYPAGSAGHRRRLRLYAVPSTTEIGRRSVFLTMRRRRGRPSPPPWAHRLAACGPICPMPRTSSRAARRSASSLEHQAEQLQFRMQNGYVILENAIPPSLVDKAALDLDRAYAGGFPDLKFDATPSRRPHRWQPEPQPAPRQGATSTISRRQSATLCLPTIAEYLGLILIQGVSLRRRWVSCAARRRRAPDSGLVPYTIPRQFAATWTALEDVTIGAGELFYYPGSHRFEFRLSERYKSVHEAQGDRRAEHARAGLRHVQSLEDRAAQRGIPSRRCRQEGRCAVGTPTCARGNPVPRHRRARAS